MFLPRFRLGLCPSFGLGFCLEFCLGFCTWFCLGLRPACCWTVVVCCSCPSHLEEEGEGIVSHLPEQLLLDLGVCQLVFVLQLGVNLPSHQEQVPPESHTHHIHVLPTVPKRAREHHVHWKHETNHGSGSVAPLHTSRC